MKGRSKFFLILVLGMLSAIGPFSIDMYLPGFPAIAKDLNTNGSTRFTLAIKLFYRYFGGAIIVWSFVRSLRSKETIICRFNCIPAYLHGLCFHHLCRRSYMVTLITGTWGLCRNGSFKGIGKRLVSGGGKC